MTTGRINQVACRAPPGRRTLPPHRAEGEYAATPAKLAAPPTARRHLHPTRSAPRGGSGAGRAKDTAGCSTCVRKKVFHRTDATPRRTRLPKKCARRQGTRPPPQADHDASEPSEKAPKLAPDQPRPTECPLRHAKHSLAARGTQRLPTRIRATADASTPRNGACSRTPHGPRLSRTPEATHRHDPIRTLRPRARHGVQGHHAAGIQGARRTPGTRGAAPAARVDLHRTPATDRETIHPTNLSQGTRRPPARTNA